MRIQHKEQFGFVTIAQNTDTVDYLNLAYLQAKNVKQTQKNSRYAVIVDAATKEKITEKHLAVFDYVIDIPTDLNPVHSKWKLLNEWQVFWLTPFKETIKLESDLLFTRSIDHWLPALRKRDIVLSVGCKNYKGQTSQVRKYRRLFDDNQLPDVYNGLMYFRYSQTATQFFSTARRILENWDSVRDHALRNYREETPSTDVLYAIAAQLIGRENCTIPSLDFFNFVHMKPGIQGWADENKWTDTVLVETDRDMIRINNQNQYYPVHYYEKTFPHEFLNDTE